MQNKISILGGDLRIANLAKLMLEEGFDVSTYGLEKTNLENVKQCNSLEELFNQAELIVSSIPLSRDGENVFAPYSNSQISLKSLQNNLKNKVFVAGKIALEFDDSVEIHDILEIEEYTVLNAIATAEGAIQIAMEEYPKTLCGSKILVMGFGRIGKILSKMLAGIGANVYCEARKNEDLAYIKAYGYVPVHLDDLNQFLNRFDIIINNIPVLILDKKRLDLLKKDVLIIDLASKPGGVDFDYAKTKKIKTIWALGLPGKVAPISAAEYIKDVLKNIQKKGSK